MFSVFEAQIEFQHREREKKGYENLIDISIILWTKKKFAKHRRIFSKQIEINKQKRACTKEARSIQLRFTSLCEVVEFVESKRYWLVDVCVCVRASMSMAMLMNGFLDLVN